MIHPPLGIAEEEKKNVKKYTERISVLTKMPNRMFFFAVNPTFYLKNKVGSKRQ
jgi:hypothetical protein